MNVIKLIIGSLMATVLLLINIFIFVDYNGYYIFNNDILLSKNWNAPFVISLFAINVVYVLLYLFKSKRENNREIYLYIGKIFYPSCALSLFNTISFFAYNGKSKVVFYVGIFLSIIVLFVTVTVYLYVKKDDYFNLIAKKGKK